LAKLNNTQKLQPAFIWEQRPNNQIKESKKQRIQFPTGEQGSQVAQASQA
jgi:hypothetical protein